MIEKKWDIQSRDQKQLGMKAKKTKTRLAHVSTNGLSNFFHCLLRKSPVNHIEEELMPSFVVVLIG